MTPRTIESEFSELLKADVQHETNFDLTLDGPLTGRIHPKVLWAKLQFKNNPGQEIADEPIHGWYFEAFENMESARSTYPDVALTFFGQPWAVNKFLSSGAETAIIDFKDLGCAFLTRNPQSKKKKDSLSDHILSAWLTYALSPELWGPVGKWTRFHARIHELLQKHALLGSEDAIGYYPLKNRAETLAKSGFQGTHLDKLYLLVLPWTFSLSALEKLEKTIQQEF